MKKTEILKSSLRILKRNKMRTFFMVLGIIIGIASLSLTFTIGKSFQKQISERAKKYVGTNDIIIRAEKLKLDVQHGPQINDMVSTLTIDDLKVIVSEVPGITDYDPAQFLPDQEIIAGNRNIATMVRGSSAKGQFIWNRQVSKGEYINEADELNTSRVAVIGPRLAETLFGTSNPLGAQVRIGNVPFIVKGVLEPKGMDPHGNDMDLEIIVPITTLMKRMMNVDYIIMAKFVIDDENRMDDIVAGISATLDERHHLSGTDARDYSIITPTFVREKIKEMTRVFSVLLPLISLIALLASGIVIIVLMLMSVNGRISEIGLRKAVGARSKDILFQFLTEVSLTSLIGGLIGTLIGLGFFKAFGVFMNLPFYIPWQLYVFGIILPVLVGIVAGIIPARKAAKYHPVIALK